VYWNECRCSLLLLLRANSKSIIYLLTYLQFGWCLLLLLPHYHRTVFNAVSAVIGVPPGRQIAKEMLGGHISSASSATNFSPSLIIVAMTPQILHAFVGFRARDRLLGSSDEFLEGSTMYAGSDCAISISQSRIRRSSR
jgi:hypothetical protein